MFADNVIILEGEFPSQFGEGWPLIDETVSTMREFGWSESETFGVNLAIVEAVTNAIKHGNRNDRSKTYYLRVEVTPIQVRVMVRDEGDGFDCSLIRDPRKGENLEFPNGRGIFLMREYMSAVHFNRIGNELMMVKNRTGAAGQHVCTN